MRTIRMKMEKFVGILMSLPNPKHILEQSKVPIFTVAIPKTDFMMVQHKDIGEQMFIETETLTFRISNDLFYPQWIPEDEIIIEPFDFTQRQKP